MGTIILTPSDINTLNTIKVDNNFSGVITALKANKVPYLGVQTNTGLINYLMKIYSKNQNLYFSILKSVPHNPNAGNYTTDSSFMNKIASL